MTNKGVEEFFCAIKERCSSNDEYALELLKARGFLLENREMVLSDNAHPSDEDYLNKILKAENIGEVKDGKIVISSTENIEHIFNIQYVGGGGALCNAESWQKFLHDSYAPKVSISLLEPFVARYIKAISACGVMTCNSCDGNHPEKDRFGRILVGCNDERNRLWHEIICKRCLAPQFNLKWKNSYQEINFNRQNQWQTYTEINRAAEYLYDNRILLRRIRREASDGISNSMAVHLPTEELAAIFSDRANQLMDDNLKGGASPMTEELERDLAAQWGITNDFQEFMEIGKKLFPQATEADLVKAFEGTYEGSQPK